MSDGLNVCLVLDSRYRKKFHHNEIKNLLESKHEIKLVLIDKNITVSEPNSNSINGFASKVNFVATSLIHGKLSVLTKIERYAAQRIKPSATSLLEYSDITKREDVFKSIPDLDRAETKYFEPIKTGKYTYKFSQSVVEEVVEMTDVVVLLGYSKILRGDILTDPEYGTLSFHASDFTRYRGRPIGFFQWINDEKEIGMTLQQLTEDLDGGRVIICKHANICDSHSWTNVKLQAFRLFDSMLVEGLNKLEDPEFSPEATELAELTYSREAEKPQNVIKCVLKNIQARYLYPVARVRN